MLVSMVNRTYNHRPGNAEEVAAAALSGFYRLGASFGPLRPIVGAIRAILYLYFNAPVNPAWTGAWFSRP
jgi:hypothetical protein